MRLCSRAYVVAVLCVFFFFSSRRRHTRSDRDWSSDVCSSDLLVPEARFGGDVPKAELALVQVQARAALVRREHDLGQAVSGQVADRDAAAVVDRKSVV